MPRIEEQTWHVGTDGNVYDRGTGGRLVARVRDRADAEAIARLPEVVRVLNELRDPAPADVDDGSLDERIAAVLASLNPESNPEADRA